MDKLNFEGLRVGDEIVWSSAAGFLSGVIKAIEIALNADKKMHPWLIIDCEDRGTHYQVRFSASDNYLKMMKVVRIING